MVAAAKLGCSVFELEHQSVEWVERALIALEAEADARVIRRQLTIGQE